MIQSSRRKEEHKPEFNCAGFCSEGGGLMTSKQMWGNLEHKFSDAEAKEGREGMECADHIMGKRQGLKNGSIQSELSLPPLRKTRQTRNTQVQGGQVKSNYRCDRETLL